MLNKIIPLKLIVIISCVYLFNTTSTAFAQEQKPLTLGYYPEIKDNIIIDALDSISNTDGEWARRSISGYNDINKPIKVVFKNLSSISPQFKDHDALGWKDNKGNLLIFISDRHKNAPHQAIASLLCHESIHQDQDNSIQEETYGWTYEAEVWMQLKDKYPHLKEIPPGKYPLVDRENMMEMLFRKAGFTSKLIEQQVRNNPSYKNLPETSLGFGK